MTEHRLRQEFKHCEESGISLTPLCTTTETAFCSDYGYSTYFLATVWSDGRKYVVVKPDEWPNMTFGIMLGSACVYLPPHAPTQSCSLAKQILQMPLPTTQERSVGSDADSIDVATEACVRACSAEHMTIRRYAVGLGGHVLVVSWVPTNVKFCRVQLVVVPSNWTAVGFGLVSPMPRTDKDPRGNVTMNADSVTVHYMKGKLESVLRAHILQDRLSSFSE